MSWTLTRNNTCLTSLKRFAHSAPVLRHHRLVIRRGRTSVKLQGVFLEFQEEVEYLYIVKAGWDCDVTSVQLLRNAAHGSPGKRSAGDAVRTRCLSRAKLGGLSLCVQE